MGSCSDVTTPANNDPHSGLRTLLDPARHRRGHVTYQEALRRAKSFRMQKPLAGILQKLESLGFATSEFLYQEPAYHPIHHPMAPEELSDGDDQARELKVVQLLSSLKDCRRAACILIVILRPETAIIRTEGPGRRSGPVPLIIVDGS